MNRTWTVSLVTAFLAVGCTANIEDDAELGSVAQPWDTQSATEESASTHLWVVDHALKNLEAVWASRARLPFAEREISVVSRDALIAMKARAARPQDIMDIQNLKDIDR